MVTIRLNPEAEPASFGPWPALPIVKSEPISDEPGESYLARVERMPLSYCEPSWTTCKGSDIDEGLAVASTAYSKDVDLQRFILVGGVADGGVENTIEEWDIKTKRNDFLTAPKDAQFAWSDEDPAVASTANSQDLDLHQARSRPSGPPCRSDSSGVGVASDGRVPVEMNAEKSRIKTELDGALTALNKASQSIIEKVGSKWLTTESAMRDEKKRLEVERDEERQLLTDTRIALQERVTHIATLEDRLHAALVALNEKDTEILSMRIATRDDRKRKEREFDAAVNAMRVEQQRLEAVVIELRVEQESLEDVVNIMRLEQENLEAEQDQKKHEAVSAQRQLLERINEKMDLQSKLNSAIIALKDERAKFDDELGRALMERKKAEEKLFSVGNLAGSVTRSLEGERDAAILALAEKEAEMLHERNENVELSAQLAAALCKKRKLEHDLIVIGDEMAEERTQLERANKVKLERALSEYSRLKWKLLAAISKKKELEVELISLGKEKTCVESELISMGKEQIRLESDRNAIQTKFEEEAEKNLCQICQERPKDTVVFPCLHLQFCYTCLVKHRKKKNKACPICRTSISGELRCHV